MKHFFTTCKAACLAAVAALTAACGSEADYRTALPADAFVTMSFNPAQLAAKSGMGDMSQHPLCLRIEKLRVIVHADLLGSHDDLQGVRLRVLIGSEGDLLRVWIHI